MLKDFESFIHKALACLGLVLNGGGRNYLLTNSQIIRTTFDNCSSCYFRLQTKILLIVPLVIYFLLDTISQGISYCSSYYLFSARIQPPGFCLLFHLLLILARIQPPGFAYSSTCYLFYARIHPPRVLLTVPLDIFILCYKPSPRFILLFHLLFILR